MRTVMRGAAVGLVLSLVPAMAQASGFNFGQSTNEKIKLMPGEDFFYLDAHGREHHGTAGPKGATVIIANEEKGSVQVPLTPADALHMNDPNYGLHGEPPIGLNGQVESGTGQFTVSLSGFQDISDVSATVTATLTSNGTDDPVHASLFGQGDQLQPPKNGTVSYTTKWVSTDLIPLSNGDSLRVGDFYVSSLGTPSSFTDSIDLTKGFDATADLTIGDELLLVKDINQAPIGDNLLDPLIGSATIHLQSVPETNTVLSFGAVSAFGGLMILRRRRRA